MRPRKAINAGIESTVNIIRGIFDPFFTTKPPGAGTGLGLSISRAQAPRVAKTDHE